MQIARRTGRRGVRRDERSSVALEFALVAPILVILFFAFYDISDAMITYEEVFNAARVISSSVTNISVQGADASTKLYYGQIQLEASAIFAQIPTIRSGFHNGIKSITISSVNFEEKATTPACTPGVNCVYLPFVVWSVAYAGPPAADSGLSFTGTLRSCATDTTINGVTSLNVNSALAQTAPNAGQASDLTSLRTLYVTNQTYNTSGTQYPAAPDPIIVVDVHYQYVPLFNLFVKSPIDFWANGYWPLRSVQTTELNTATNTFTPLQPDQQYTQIVATPTTENGAFTGYTIVGGTNTNGQLSGGQVYPPTSGLSGASPPTSTYCISPYYAEPST